MFYLYEKTALACSKASTHIYSTSFSLGIKMIAREYRWAIYGIYGFVRLADEIVDTFDREDKAELLSKFKADTFEAIEKGISLNPILYTFQKAVKSYQIDSELIHAFFESMEADLIKKEHTTETYQQYIYGSAEVVGLMCLKVFCDGNNEACKDLKSPARALGAAFQKVNFLRDIKSDMEERGRIYFPQIDLSHFNEHNKQEIIADIRRDFRDAYEGIKRLPMSCRFGVYTSYKYYLSLLDKIERAHTRDILESRIRVPNPEKIVLLAKSFFRYKLNAL